MIEEVKLSSIVQRIDNNEVCFISACKDNYSNNENQKRNKKLEADVRALGYKFIQILGGCPENSGSENKQDLYASSLVVINTTDENYNPNFAKEMLYLCGKYEQDCVLLKAADFATAWYSTKGERKSETLPGLSVNDFADGFRKIHGHKFSVIEAGEYYSDEIKSHKSVSEYVAGVWLRKAIARNIYSWEDVD